MELSAPVFSTTSWNNAVSAAYCYSILCGIGLVIQTLAILGSIFKGQLQAALIALAGVAMLGLAIYSLMSVFLGKQLCFVYVLVVLLLQEFIAMVDIIGVGIFSPYANLQQRVTGWVSLILGLPVSLHLLYILFVAYREIKYFAKESLTKRVALV